MNYSESRLLKRKKGNFFISINNLLRKNVPTIQSSRIFNIVFLLLQNGQDLHMRKKFRLSLSLFGQTPSKDILGSNRHFRAASFVPLNRPDLGPGNIEDDHLADLLPSLHWLAGQVELVVHPGHHLHQEKQGTVFNSVSSSYLRLKVLHLTDTAGTFPFLSTL